MSRRAQDWTADFEEIGAAVGRLAPRDLIDGEVCALDGARRGERAA